jgi:hypothetical protein
MVTDRFEFPSVLDIREYTTDASDSIPYQLKSVALHSGTVDERSYSSVVRICGQWFVIDESGVWTLDDRSFKKKTFSAGSTCAHLLFYVKTGAKVVIEKIRRGAHSVHKNSPGKLIFVRMHQVRFRQ